MTIIVVPTKDVTMILNKENRYFGIGPHYRSIRLLATNFAWLAFPYYAKMFPHGEEYSIIKSAIEHSEAVADGCEYDGKYYDLITEASVKAIKRHNRSIYIEDDDKDKIFSDEQYIDAFYASYVALQATMAEGDMNSVVHGLVNIRNFFPSEKEEIKKQYLNELSEPFQPVEWQLQYHTTTAVDLATTIYNERRWDLSPILADALMDAGFQNEKVIFMLTKNYQRLSRGVWVVDKLRGYK